MVKLDPSSPVAAAALTVAAQLVLSCTDPITQRGPDKIRVLNAVASDVAELADKLASEYARRLGDHGDD